MNASKAERGILAILNNVLINLILIFKLQILLISSSTNYI